MTHTWITAGSDEISRHGSCHFESLGFIREYSLPFKTWVQLVVFISASVFAEKQLRSSSNADPDIYQLTVSLLTTPLLLESRDTFLIGIAITEAPAEQEHWHGLGHKHAKTGNQLLSPG